MKVNRTSLRATGFFVASCVVAVLAVQGVYDWERGRGTHTGSWAVGTEAGLRSGLFPLLVIVGLSIASVLSARRRARVLAAVAALMLVAATVYGVRTAGGRAVVDRYNDFPTVPPCAHSWNFEPDEPGFTTPRIRRLAGSTSCSPTSSTQAGSGSTPTSRSPDAKPPSRPR